MRSIPALVHLICLPLLATAAFAQAPQCLGISDISDFDGSAVSDLDGSLDTVLIANGFIRPLLVTSPPGDAGRLFVVEQDGLIRILKAGILLPIPFLDVSSLTQSPADPGGGNEEGLLGLTFHPAFASNGWVFVYHTDSTGANNLLVRYTISSGNPDIADVATRQVVLTLAHPTNQNHNGGSMAFGPSDGLLYIGTGDGGGSCDAPNNAQNLQSNLGKLLRLEVNSLPYSIPPGNPFITGTGNDEIWSLGLRNPWRFSFDRITGALYIGDVGQGTWEEVDCQPAGDPGGLNHGWDRYEGAHCPNPSCGSQGSCTLGSYSPPIQEYSHSSPAGSCAITGGFVYRGCRMGDLRGTYFYSDYCSAFIRSFRTDAACSSTAPLLRTVDLDPSGATSIRFINSYGEDAQGEMYLVDQSGEIFKIIPALRIMETSGIGAGPLLLSGGGPWTWEDLQASSSSPITLYRLYRSTAPAGTFACLHQSATPAWASGDPANPGPGSSFFYLVTARNSAGEETRPGQRSDGTPRSVDTISICPP